MEIAATISSSGSKNAPILFQGDYAEEVARAASLGFKAVELHIRDPKAIDRKRLLQTLERTEQKVSAIGTGRAFGEDRIFFSSPDAEIRSRAVQRIKDHIDLASELPTKVIIGLIRGPLPELEGEKNAARPRVIDCFKECASYAEKLHVSLAVEAINRYETNFLNTAEETENFIKAIGSSLLGIHLDTFHMNIEEISIEGALKEHGKRLLHMHLADSNRHAPGMGHLDFYSILSALRDIGYRGYLSLECLPGADPFGAAKHAFRYLGELLSKIRPQTSD